jgi:hypothetical protein
VVATAHRLHAVLLDAHPQLIERARPGWHPINYRGSGTQVRMLVFQTLDDVDTDVVTMFLTSPSGWAPRGGHAEPTATIRARSSPRGRPRRACS